MFGVFLKLLRHFKSLPAFFSLDFPSLGRKFLPQVSPLCTPVHHGLADRATPSTGQGLSASRAPTRPALLSPPPGRPGTEFPPSPFLGLRAPTLVGLGLRVTNFSQPPAEGPDGARAAGASWRVAAPRMLMCPRRGRLGTPRLCVRSAGSPVSQACFASVPTICHSIPEDWNFLCFA